MSLNKQRFTLDSAMSAVGCKFPEGSTPWVTYDPAMKPQYRIIRQQSHDGTLLFTRELLMNALTPLLLRTSYFMQEPPGPEMVPHYIVGEIKLLTVFGMVSLPVGEYPGQRERVIIPVRAYWAKGSK